MSSGHAILDAASIERKARLAKLASLKRKQPELDSTPSFAAEEQPASVEDSEDYTNEVTRAYLSGRNYDPDARGPKLGFESAPNAGEITLEDQAGAISQKTQQEAAREEEAAINGGIDLFKLQPKKPNWDLKRDLDKKLEILDVRTQNAIAKLVRERIQIAKKEASTKSEAFRQNGTCDGSEEVGMEGSTLVEGIHQRELEEQEAGRREKIVDGDLDEAPA